ncbi:MAG: divalent-cation tolerance protein CutA [Xanthomonadales bacterium]|nr:divalent-cation tolerance protein CutA [Xanthomonadales bacterium]
MQSLMVILCTAPDEAVAARLAGSLVEARLAACVNILPAVRSIYRWKGEVQNESEVLMVIKTEASQFERVEAWLQANHPYDVPEVVGLAAEAVSADYGKWVADSVALVNRKKD